MTEIVVTMVEGNVDPARVPDSREAFPAEECIKSVATPGAKAPSRLPASSQRSPCGARIAFSSIRDPNATRRPPCAAQIT